jgi:hypothetical protein
MDEARPARPAQHRTEMNMHGTGSLRDIREGMKVYDSTDKHIGEVEMVKFGDDDPATPQVESSGISATENQSNTLLDNIAEAFHPDDIPDEMREMLLLQGFVRIDADGLFAADRYVLPDQIRSVDHDRVTLNVSKSDLLKKRDLTRPA